MGQRTPCICGLHFKFLFPVSVLTFFSAAVTWKMKSSLRCFWSVSLAFSNSAGRFILKAPSCPLHLRFEHHHKCSSRYVFRCSRSSQEESDSARHPSESCMTRQVFLSHGSWAGVQPSSHASSCFIYGPLRASSRRGPLFSVSPDPMKWVDPLF